MILENPQVWIFVNLSIWWFLHLIFDFDLIENEICVVHNQIHTFILFFAAFKISSANFLPKHHYQKANKTTFLKTYQHLLAHIWSARSPKYIQSLDLQKSHFQLQISCNQHSPLISQYQTTKKIVKFPVENQSNS